MLPTQVPSSHKGRAGHWCNAVYMYMPVSRLLLCNTSTTILGTVAQDSVHQRETHYKTLGVLLILSPAFTHLPREAPDHVTVHCYSLQKMDRRHKMMEWSHSTPAPYWETKGYTVELAISEMLGGIWAQHSDTKKADLEGPWQLMKLTWYRYNECRHCHSMHLSQPSFLV